MTTASSVMEVGPLSPGVYRITGVLQPTTSTGATVSIHLGATLQSAARVGVAREAPTTGFVAHAGDLVRLPEVTPLLCGATFYNPSGALEWSLTFRVIEAHGPSDQLCGQ